MHVMPHSSAHERTLVTSTDHCLMLVTLLCINNRLCMLMLFIVCIPLHPHQHQPSVSLLANMSVMQFTVDPALTSDDDESIDMDDTHTTAKHKRTRSADVPKLSRYAHQQSLLIAIRSINATVPTMYRPLSEQSATTNYQAISTTIPTTAPVTTTSMTTATTTTTITTTTMMTTTTIRSNQQLDVASAA
jgi:hypothetical protein